MVDINFHCDEYGNFQHGYLARAFCYKDYSIEMHNHDFYEVNIVLSGNGTHCIETEKLDVKAGDIFVIPPNVAHAYNNTKNLEVYHILLKKSFVRNNKEESENVAGFLQLMEIEPFLRSNFSSSYFLKLNQSQLIQLKIELEFIDDYGRYGWNSFSLMKYHTIWKILYWFSGLLNQQNSDFHQNKENKYEVQILKALEFIHQHYSDKITVDLLCKTVFLSRSTLLRNFKKMSGVSPNEYLNNYRCRKALELLESSTLSKTEIAHCCGFYDLSHMDRAIKRMKS